MQTITGFCALLILFIDWLIDCPFVYIAFQILNVGAVTPILRVLMNCAASVSGTAVEVQLQIYKQMALFFLSHPTLLESFYEIFPKSSLSTS